MDIEIAKHLEAIKELRSFLPKLRMARFSSKLDFYAKLNAMENDCLTRLFGKKKRIKLILCQCWGTLNGCSQSQWTYYDFCLDLTKNVYTSEFVLNFRSGDYIKWAKKHFKDASRTLAYQRWSSTSNWKDILRRAMISTLVFPADDTKETALLVNEINKEILGELI